MLNTLGTIGHTRNCTIENLCVSYCVLCAYVVNKKIIRRTWEAEKEGILKIMNNA